MKECVVEGCSKKPWVRGYCANHYKNGRLHNTIPKLHNNTQGMTMKERLTFYSEKNGECLEWRGALNPNGYGVVTSKGRNYLAHRESYKEYIGKLDDGLFVLHKCDNPLCINPEHLFAGTHQDNMDDMVAKGHHQQGERNVTAKLSNADVVEIKRLLARGYTNADIAKRFHVCSSNISMIATGKTWKHIENALTDQERIDKLRAALEEAISLWREEFEYRSGIDAADKWQEVMEETA